MAVPQCMERDRRQLARLHKPCPIPAIPVLRGTFTPLTLTPFKLGAICHFSHELAEFSSTSVPGGLLAGVTPITASAATPPTAAMAADFKALLAALTYPVRTSCL